MPIWLLTGLGAARNVTKSAFTWITANTTHLLAVILAISALWGLYERHEAAKYHRALESCSAARAADRAAYIAAQKEALVKAQTARAAVEQKYAALATKVDTDEKQVRNQAMADAERYIAAHRLRITTGSASSASSTANPAPQDNSPEGGYRSSEAPQLATPNLVYVTPDDIRICTENTTRLEAVHEWATNLQNYGYSARERRAGTVR